VLRSDDRGRSWTSIAGDLPDRHVAWDLVEDPENENLLFLGTEFALFLTADGGERWIEMEGGLPTIAYRDIEIHEGMGDLVTATFGRGWWVLDDYTPLRSVTPDLLNQDAALFDVRQAYVYSRLGYYESSSGEYVAENSPFGAIVNYYLREPVPDEDGVVMVIRDGAGAQVAEVPAGNEAGIQRTVWNLRSQPPQTETEEGQRRRARTGPLVEPGTYTVTLEARSGDLGRQLAGPVTVQVVPLPVSRR
jgi:hypothetical protein